MTARFHLITSHTGLVTHGYAQEANQSYMLILPIGAWAEDLPTEPRTAIKASEAIEQLALADEAYEIARMMAVPLPLAEKIIALRNAKNARTEAYEAVGRGIEARAYGEMCRKPEACADKGYCPLDPTCAD